MGLFSDPPADLRYTHPKSAIVIRRCCVAGFYLHVATHVDARLFASGSPLKTLMSIHLSNPPVKRGDSYIAGVLPVALAENGNAPWGGLSSNMGQ